MGWNAAWHASNTMVGYMGDAANDLAGEKQHFDNIVGADGELFNLPSSKWVSILNHDRKSGIECSICSCI